MTLYRSDNLILTTHDRLAELDKHWSPKPVMVSTVQFPVFLFCCNILKPLYFNIVQKCQICVANEYLE